MKKTPASFASTPAQQILNAAIASAAITGIVNSMDIPAKATTQDSASYNSATQKLVQNDVHNAYTYGNVQTSSRTGSGSFETISNDDNNSYTDNG
jgi:hypothetical protein